MSAILQIKNIHFSNPSKPLFRGLDLSISSGDKIGLVGHNGSGKSSLFSLLARQNDPDDGEIMHPRGLQFGLVEQFVPSQLQQKSLQQAVLDQIPEAERETDLYKVQALLFSLGFDSHQLTLKLKELSGGQQNLALLARAMIVEPELLLMDEPGNHMDVLALSHLRRYLLGQRQLSFVMISHDRDLLDSCCNRTCFLRDLKLLNFNLPYSQAKTALEEHDEKAEQRRHQEIQEIKRVKDSAKRLAVWGRTYDVEKLSRKAKSMERRAEKMESELTETTRGSGLDLSLESNSFGGKTVVTMENLEVFTPAGNTRLLDCELLVAKPGDRIALLGENGSGKSTTLNRLIEEFDQPASDSIRFNPNVSLIYYDQELQQFDQEYGRFDWLRERVQQTSDDSIKRALIQSGVSYQNFDLPVNQLSGGEKARMMFLLIRLVKPNLLILDEPTNHIDLEGREQLEQQLASLNATVIVTSHDRRFLENIATRFWVIRDNKLIEEQTLLAFYESLDDTQSVASEGNIEQAPGQENEAGEDAGLHRIVELEDLLKADKKRKPKFQKPEKQRLWQEELEQLWEQLE